MTSYRNRIKNIAVISEENKEEEFHSSSLRNKMKNIAAIAKEHNVVERMTPAERSTAYATLQKMYLAKTGGKSRMKKKKKSGNRARKTKKTLTLLSSLSRFSSTTTVPF